MRETAAGEEQTPKAEKRAVDPAQPAKKKLSYLESREYATIEQRVEAADERVRAAHAAIDDPTITRDPAALTSALKELETAQAEADALYSRWAELTEKVG